MKKDFNDWNECLNLREVKVCHRSTLCQIYVTNAIKTYHIVDEAGIEASAHTHRELKFIISLYVYILKGNVVF